MDKYKLLFRVSLLKDCVRFGVVSAASTELQVYFNTTLPPPTWPPIQNQDHYYQTIFFIIHDLGKINGYLIKINDYLMKMNDVERT